MAYSLDQSKFLNDDELARLNDKLKQNYNCDHRNVTIVNFYKLTGVRAQEGLNVKRKDLNESDCTVFIRGLKGSRNREIPLPKWLFRDLMKIACSTGGIFGIKYRALDNVWRKYRPCAKGIKSLRHTFGINLYKRTRDIKLVQLALGHKAISNTLIYLEYDYSKEQMRKALIDEVSEAV